MQKPILLACLGCVVTLVGCAAGPDFKTYSSTLTPPKEGESRVWFYRPSKITGRALQPTVYMNGSPTGKAQPGSFFYADKPAGTYELKCTTEWPDKTQLTVVQNQVHYVRLTVVPGVVIGHVLPKVVTKEKGLREIQKCRLITADGRNKNWKPPAKSATSEER